MNEFHSIEEALASFKKADNEQTFEMNVTLFKQYLKQDGMSAEGIKEFERRAYYLPNEYSKKDTQERMMVARERVISYIEQFLDNEESNILLQVLEHYDLFLENLIERDPNKRAGIRKEQLSALKIENEYDVQHLLFAYLKPLYPMARTEVNQDTGYATVRTDISLDSETLIEVKCTRPSMQLGKLKEEIAADMIHYSEKNIYFFIYDKEKIIKEPQIFKKTYEKMVKEKNIHITIHQPKIL